MRYIPQFDTLRAFAVLLTLVAHWFPAVGLPLLPYTWYGVDLFFALSGFLITYILLETKDKKIQTGASNVPSEIKKFMIRRGLRLFPVYFLFLAGLYLLYKFVNIHLWRPEMGIFLWTYTVNILFFFEGRGTGTFDHIWSLCVEEQFYLFWPWVIFLSPKKYLLPLILFLIGISIFGCLIWKDIHTLKNLPFFNFHVLGIGCLGALIHQSEMFPKWKNLLKEYHFLGFIISLFALIYILFFAEINKNSYLFVFLNEALLALTTVGLVISLYWGWKNIFFKVVDNPFTRYLGKISYGVYVYHMPVPVIVKIILDKLQLSLNSILLLVLYSFLTLLVATISYYTIEQRALKLKNKFN